MYLSSSDERPNEAKINQNKKNVQMKFQPKEIMFGKIPNRVGSQAANFDADFLYLALVD